MVCGFFTGREKAAVAGGRRRQGGGGMVEETRRRQERLVVVGRCYLGLLKIVLVLVDSKFLLLLTFGCQVFITKKKYVSLV